MRPRERRDSGQRDLFKARLDQIVDLGHPLARLAATVDWRFLEERFGAVYSDRAGQPPLPTRLMAGLSILKHTHNLSDEELCARFLENPYFQLFCGEEFFRHKLPFDRTSLTRWRQRMGEEKLVALIQESLSAATRTGAAKPSDFAKVIVDTTVQPKAVAFPTDAKLMHRARELLVRLAKKHGVRLRQSYARVGKRALIAYQRYAHAKQFKRAGRALRSVRTYLGRVLRDAMRKTNDNAALRQIFAEPMSLAFRVRHQTRRQRGRKIYSLHAPEVECIGKGIGTAASAPNSVRCVFGPRSRGRAQDDSWRNFTRHRHPPEHDEQFARERHDHRVSRAAASVDRSRVEPLGQLAVFLEQEEAPSQLNHSTSHSSVASAGKALLFSPLTALVGRTGQTGIARNGPSIA